jgi:hypothetical protein
MRSELVFAAMAHFPNRFLLTKLAAKATRKFHRPNTPVQATVNDVLVRFRNAKQVPEPRNALNKQPNRHRKLRDHAA